MQAQPRSGLDSALARIGDRWSLLVVDALLDGPLRYNELAEALPGISTNILAQRLRGLEDQGVIVATPYSERPPRFRYALTATGHELAGAVRLLAQWGADHAGEPAEGAGGHVHGRCGTRLEARWYCPTCARTLDDGEDDAPVYV